MKSTHLKGATMNLLVLLLVTNGVLPATASAAGESGVRTLSAVHIENASFATVYAPTGSSFSNPDNCGRSDFLALPASDPSYKVQLGVILSGYLAGKQMDFWLSGCQTTPWGTTVPVISTTSVLN